MTDDHDADFLETGASTAEPWLADAREALADQATYTDLPIGLEDAVVAAIAAEAADGRADPVVTEVAFGGPAHTDSAVPAADTHPGPVDELAARRRTWGNPLVLAAAAVVAVLAFGVGMLVGSDDDPERDGQEFALVASDLAPEAEGRVEFADTSSGLRVDLWIDGLPGAVEGTYYQGWVRTDDGTSVTIGTFHLRDADDPVILWAGVDFDDVVALGVTRQELGGGPESSGEVVLSVLLDDPPGS